MNKLFMMDFPVEEVKIDNYFRDKAILEEIRKTTPDKGTIPKIEKVFGELLFPPAPEDRPYSFCSVVLSSDGKMAFSDNQAGPLIAKNNFFDPKGALADFWVLNALRTYSDGVIIGGKTLQSEPHATSHVFDKDMARERKEVLGKCTHPLNIVVSLDATDIPFDHIIFNVDESEDFQVAIATSPQGGEYVKANFKKEYKVLGPYMTKEEVDVEEAKKALADKKVIPLILTGTEDKPDSDLLMWILRKAGMERLLIESPSYNWHLMKNGNLDEYFINYSMVYAGGLITPGSYAPFGFEEHPHAKLLSLGIHMSSFIFTRQKLYYGVNALEDMSKYKY